MSTELNDVRKLRPVVQPPSDPARAAAWQRLVAAIEDEPVGWHDRHHAHEDHARHRRRPRAELPWLGRLRGPLGLGAAIGVVVIVVGLVVLLAGRGPAPRRSAPASGHGVITAGGHALAPGVIRKGLEQQYRTQLAAGDTLQTSLDPALQAAGRRTLARSLTLNHAAAGAYVAMDPQTGAVRAIGSVSRGARTRSRMIDLATGFAGPVGMTFAPIAALGALRSGDWSIARHFEDNGEFCIRTAAGPLQCRFNRGHAKYGLIGVPRALQVEDDLFLDDLANITEPTTASDRSGGPIQVTADGLGIGKQSGIDLPGETPGELPTPASVSATHHSWSTSDNEDLATGQSAEVSPIQLAVAYAAIANGGTVVQPRVGAALTGNGHSLAIAEQHQGRLQIAPAQLATVRDGLRRAVTSGVLHDTMGDLPVPVSGQIGSVQSSGDGQDSTSAWFAGYAPASHGHTPLVVVAFVDQGVFADVSAAPVARRLFSQWFTGQAGAYVTGSSTAG